MKLKTLGKVYIGIIHMKLKKTGKSINRYYTHEIEKDWEKYT
jgi:hypothetical protein